MFDVAEYRNGKAHENDIAEDGVYIVVNSKFVSTDGAVKKYSNKQNEPLKKNEIAFVLSDVPNGRAIAKTFLVDKSGKYTLNQRIAGITPHSDINPKFLSVTMNRNKYFLQFDDGVKQTNLSLDDMKKFEEFYPCKIEQDKIANIMTNIDNLITLHHRKYTYIFYSWEQRKLGEIGNTFTGLSGKTKEDFGHGEAKFVTYMNVFSNPIAQLNKTEPIEIDNKQNQVEYGDVFFTTSSETPDEVGMSSVWLENKGNIYLNSFCFGFRPFVKNDPYYMAYMLRSKNFRKNMILLAQGISRYNISKNGVMNIDIQLPNNQEQEKIGKLFYEIDNLITLHLSIRNKEEKRFYKIMYKNPDKSLLERVMEFDYLQCLGVVEQNLEII